jgi:hypothetical protein
VRAEKRLADGSYVVVWRMLKVFPVRGSSVKVGIRKIDIDFR